MNTTSTSWKGYEKILFRFAFIYFLLQSLPLDGRFFRHLFSINWLELSYGDIFYLTRFSPKFFGGDDSFYNWGIIALIALSGTIIWTFRDRYTESYNNLLYWLRVIVRYRLAIALIGYGIIKLFPMQAPEPSISNLNTNYGDLSNWKVFTMSLAIVPGYQSFLGLVEIVAGGLLFWRKTTTIGAFLVIVFTGNVFMSNLAYEGGEHIYSLYLISFALFLFSYDVIRLYRLFGEERPVSPSVFRPKILKEKGSMWIIGKSLVIFFFVILYGFKTYSGFQKGSYHYPGEAGISGTEGIYNVSEFRINDKIYPYSTTDPVRWKDVVFEKWNTISIRSNQPVNVVHAKVEEIHSNNAERDYEYAGTKGRLYYSYELQGEQLILNCRNGLQANHQLNLQYERPSQDQIILHGTIGKKDSLYVVLDRLPKKYLIDEARGGRNKTIKL